MLKMGDTFPIYPGFSQKTCHICSKLANYFFKL
jgi:hypothetical protein